MTWKTNHKHPQGYQFEIVTEIEFDSGAQRNFHAYYLIGIDRDGYALCNYFQESLEAAQIIARMKFDVPEDSWVKCEDGDQTS